MTVIFLINIFQHGSKENVGKTDEDEGFVETPGGTLSHDSGRGDSIRTRHDSSMSQLMTSQGQCQGHYHIYSAISPGSINSKQRVTGLIAGQ